MRSRMAFMACVFVASTATAWLVAALGVPGVALDGRLRERSAALMHTDETFTFVANAPMRDVAPLFGAAQEKLWAPGWDPQFVWPASGEDREGMVFTVMQAQGTAIWINTRFDLEAGDVQYVYTIPDVMTTRITLAVAPEGTRTRVRVNYERTALDDAAAAVVVRMAEADAKAGPEWEAQINAYLGRHPT